jgi:SAM-dependent methyltransferase
MAACGVCGGARFAAFFRSREWSPTGRYLRPGEAAPNPGPIAIALEYCQECGLIRQQPGREVQLDYTGIERDTAKQLPDYSRRIIASLAGFGVGPDHLIVEAGANDGTFLKALRDAGYRNLIGVEPSRRLAARASEAGLTMWNSYFGPAVAADIARRHGPVRAVICRHTLEHVPDIRALTQGLAGVLAPGGLAFIEVPDTDWIIANLFAHEIWDEHISYFRASSLLRLAVSAGLSPLRIERERFRDTCNLLCWAVRPEHEPAPDECGPDEPAAGERAGSPASQLADTTSPADLASFQARWDAFAARLRRAVAAAPRPLIAIGASHIQLNFLNFAGLDASVDLLIDDDPVKAGRFAPLAAPVPIRPTAAVLASVRAGTILHTAFPYPAWEDRIRASLAPHGVGSIRPYDIA